MCAQCTCIAYKQHKQVFYVTALEADRRQHTRGACFCLAWQSARLYVTAELCNRHGSITRFSNLWQQIKSHGCKRYVYTHTRFKTAMLQIVVDTESWHFVCGQSCLILMIIVHKLVTRIAERIRRGSSPISLKQLHSFHLMLNICQFCVRCFFCASLIPYWCTRGGWRL